MLEKFLKIEKSLKRKFLDLKYLKKKKIILKNELFYCKLDQ